MSKFSGAQHRCLLIRCGSSAALRVGQATI
uniref:Uncharacterized protein n=1 Tax=Romanomermis culicivorax TaxID=13658 RepID=A0A915IUZ2_ROMCU